MSVVVIRIIAGQEALLLLDVLRERLTRTRWPDETRPYVLAAKLFRGLGDGRPRRQRRHRDRPPVRFR